ncbi:MAG: hypothetical protein ACLR8Y_16995 [Alistipes indistinctus]
MSARATAGQRRDKTIIVLGPHRSFGRGSHADPAEAQLIVVLNLGRGDRRQNRRTSNALAKSNRAIFVTRRTYSRHGEPA